jgi:hypothetical protein
MPNGAHHGDTLGRMVFGLNGQGVFAHGQTKGKLALWVGCDPDGGAHRLSGGAGFHLSTFQSQAFLVQDAARNHNTGWHDQIAEISGIARRKQEWLASQGQLVSRRNF